jgi:dTDP-4-amino-4,6-dideoxygalactose transaminase
MQQEPISLFKVFMSEDVLGPLNKVIMSGQLTQGPKVEEFENALTTYIGNPYILTLNSATAGLTLALKLLKMKGALPGWPGFDTKEDIVLTPALTCFATTSAIIANNANIQWLDVDVNTCNIDLNDLRQKLKSNTKIIYLVHWGGTPVDLDELDTICNEHMKIYGFKPMVIEDCAHAFGAEYNGKKLGNNNNICVFSLQAIKHLTTGDGGFITLPTQHLYDRCKLLRWYGIDRDKRNYRGKDLRLENDIVESGYKFHMNDVNATIGLYNLPHIPNLLEKNRKNAMYFENKLKNIKGIQLLTNNSKCISAYWLYTIRILNGKKQEFMDKMKNVNIMTSQVHNRNDNNSCVKEYTEHLPNLDIFEKELVCIPVGWWLEQQDLDRIIDKIITIFE